LCARPSFEQADSSQRAVIVALAVMALLFRALVIRQRMVQLTTADQRQLVTASVCAFLIAAVISVYLEQVEDAHQWSPSRISAQYTVLELLAVQVIAQTIIRLRATEESFFDSTDWPWSSMTAHAPSGSALFAFYELTTRVVMGCMKSAAIAAAIAVAKFILLNHVPLSQAVMVITGLASSGATSLPSIETSSIIIACIPLITGGALLLHNMVNIVTVWRQKWRGRGKQAGSCRSDRDSFY
jgi:hypothetical protein